MNNVFVPGKILHVMSPDKKFIPPFINFVEKHFNGIDQHVFFVAYGMFEKNNTDNANIIFAAELGKIKKYGQLLALMNRADKIILHNIVNTRVVLILALQPWLLKKCYWVMWGGDLYHYQVRARGLKSDINEAIRAFVIKRIGHFVTHIKGDYELAQQWYGAKGRWHECFMYPSNLYKEYPITLKAHDTINIQVGNSADPSNNHIEALEKLKVYCDHNIRIYVPLSYGDKKHAEEVVACGKANFGDKFIPLLEFMPFEKYLELLAQIDIAIFNHRRQQGFGNTITLLGLGKKVYMHTKIVTWGALCQLGLHVFDVENLDLSPLSIVQEEENKKNISVYFSEANLVAQLSSVFGTANFADSRRMAGKVRS